MDAQGGKQACATAAVAAAPQSKPAGGGSVQAWIPSLCLAFVALLSVTSIYRARDDPETEAFVIVSFLDLFLLYACIRRFEATPRDSPWRTPIKVAVWILTTLITVLFVRQATALSPATAFAVIAWGMAACSIGAGFVMLIVIREKADAPTNAAAAAAAADQLKPFKRVEEP